MSLTTFPGPRGLIAAAQWMSNSGPATGILSFGDPV
jgi:hypothetical protein